MRNGTACSSTADKTRGRVATPSGLSRWPRYDPRVEGHGQVDSVTLVSGVDLSTFMHTGIRAENSFLSASLDASGNCVGSVQCWQ